MSILGFLFFIIIGLILFGTFIINSILRFLFGGRKQPRRQSSYSSGQQSSNEESRYDRQSGFGQPTEKKKVFGKDEGEYVDFEEIKDPD